MCGEFVKLICIVLFLHLNPSFCFDYGQHFPQGDSAVNYAYSSEGTWRVLTSVDYIWNYYEQWATPNHPFDKSALISAADGTATFTARDANGYLLCDFDRNLEIDGPNEKACGPAFHEHNGRGVGGSVRGNPFTQFWLDDNWLARYMSQAYNRPLPNGLTDQPGQFMRWKVIGGDTTGWSLYNSDHFDTLSLDGLYLLAKGGASEMDQALKNWDRCLEKSEAFYDASNQQFEYPGLHENYHMGLWKILTENLLQYHHQLSEDKRNQILQHAVSLRSQILNNQQVSSIDGTTAIGWISNIGSESALINTESISCGVLGLGANTKFVFEADRLPMTHDPSGNYFVRPYHALSAVVGESRSGLLSSGPQGGVAALSRGNYKAEFLLRTPHTNVNSIATVSVFDEVTRSILASREVTGSHFHEADSWTVVELPFDINSDNKISLQFRTEWHGSANLDISAVRIK